MNQNKFRAYGLSALVIVFFTLIGLRAEWIQLGQVAWIILVALCAIVIVYLVELLLPRLGSNRSQEAGELDMQTESRAQAILKVIQPVFAELGIQQYKFFILDLHRKQFSQIYGKGSDVVPQNHSLIFAAEHFHLKSLKINDVFFEKLPEVMTLDIKLLIQQLGGEQIYVLSYNNIVCGFVSFYTVLTYEQLESIKGVLSSSALAIFQSAQLTSLTPTSNAEKNDFLEFIVSKTIYFLFVILTIWWFYMPYFNSYFGLNFFEFSNLYFVIAFIGGLFAIKISREWSYYKNYSSALLFFALGLFGQVFGQVAYAVYIFGFHSSIPYPSVGDIGYFGSIFCYILGLINLSKALGLTSYVSKGRILVISLFSSVPVTILSLLLLIPNYKHDEGYLKVFLDFGYPLFQAVYVSIALLLFYATRHFSGSVKNATTFLLIAMFWQFLCDFIFTYQATIGEWAANNFNEYMYFISYTLLSLTIIRISRILKKI